MELRRDAMVADTAAEAISFYFHTKGDPLVSGLINILDKG